MGKHNERPMTVTIIGWLFIVIGGLMLISGSLDLIAFDQYGSVKLTNISPGIQETPAFFQSLLNSYQKNFMLITFLQVVVSTLMLVAGACFLRLHAWARILLEGMAWLGIGYVVFVEIFYITSWVGLLSGPVANQVSKAAVTFMFLGVILGTALWGFLLAAVIKSLRGKNVRAALGKAIHEDTDFSYN